MPNTRLLKLALKGLESERARIDHEIADIKGRMNGQRQAKTAARVRPVATSVGRKTAGRGLTEEGRRRLSEAAKKRWAISRKQGKTTL